MLEVVVYFCSNCVIEHQLKTIGSTVIGVGHIIVAIPASIVGHAVNLRQGVGIGCQTAQVLDIHVVHAYDDIEAVEVVSRYGTGTMVETIAPPRGMAAHAGIGQLSGMAAVSTGRVDVKRGREATLLDHVSHNAFGGRGTADVAQADKKYATRTFGGGMHRHRLNRIYIWAQRYAFRGDPQIIIVDNEVKKSQKRNLSAGRKRVLKTKQGIGITDTLFP